MKIRILEDYYGPQAQKYTWNPQWINPFESAYSLLSKFALLNGLSLHEMSGMFVARKPRGGITKAREQGIRLFNAHSINSTSFCELLGLSDQALINAFPQPAFDPKLVPFFPELRYCRRCMSIGFHSVMHQMEMFNECPIHFARMQTGCPHCKRMLPYQLTPHGLHAPFQCEHCEAALAPHLLERRLELLKLPPAKIRMLEELWKVLRYDPEHPIWGRHALDKSEFAWFDESLAHTSVKQRRANYLHFLCSVDHQLHPESSVSKPEYTDPVLELDAAVRPLRIACAEKTPTRDQHHLLKWRNNNDLLWHLVPYYKSLCRYLWRHVVREHQRCVNTAVNHIWWQVVYTPTKPICPVAFAFVRWRMFWEGHSTPHRLVEAAWHPPYRLMAWLSDAAPFCPPTWPVHIRYWVVGRVLLNDLLASYYREVDEAIKLSRKSIEKWKWHHELASGHNPTYWAVVESGDVPRMVRAFFEVKMPSDQAVHVPFDALHMHQHLSSVNAAQC